MSNTKPSGQRCSRNSPLMLHSRYLHRHETWIRTDCSSLTCHTDYHRADSSWRHPGVKMLQCLYGYVESTWGGHSYCGAGVVLTAPDPRLFSSKNSSHSFCNAGFYWQRSIKSRWKYLMYSFQKKFESKKIIRRRHLPLCIHLLWLLVWHERYDVMNAQPSKARLIQSTLMMEVSS